MKLNCISPVLQVSDLPKAISFYVDVLGFEQDFVYGDPPFYGGIKRDAYVIHLNCNQQNADRVGKGSLYLFCDEVSAYYEEVQGRGAKVTSELNTWPYGMQDFQLADLDGNLLTFGAPAEDGQ